MKKSLVLGILGLATAAVTSYGQGAVFLDNYFQSTFNPILVQNGLFSHEFIPIPAGWTVGLYYDPTPNQNIVAAVNAAEAADPMGVADPHSLNAALVAATGPGSTAPILSDFPGYFQASSSFMIQPGATTPAQASYTIVVVAYNGSSYMAGNTAMRGYSQAVFIQDAFPSIADGTADIGNFFPKGSSYTETAPMFEIWIVPEPDTLALAGLGGLSLWLLRRKKA
jgi:hypothetical protein